jgi:phosphoribosyl 1,2-cyclic phosphodiesterase
MRIRFWGVRGSIPCPGPDTVRYGGNTACIELRVDGRLIIIDAGSGIRPLAEHLIRTDLKNGPINTEIFITHTHWDHIMGFPFFVPIYIPGTQLRVYGPVTYEDEGLDRIIGDQLTYRYFPVKHSELAAKITYFPMKEATKDLGDGITLTTKYLNHPILCLGYKFEHKGKIFCTLYDTEPFRNVFPTNPTDPNYDELAAQEGELAAREENGKILEFIQGVDVLVYDAQYTQKEYSSSKLGWGHSSFEFAVNSCHKADVKRVFLFHHDPLRTDDQLDELEARYRSMLAGKSRLQVSMAREGVDIDV